MGDMKNVLFIMIACGMIECGFAFGGPAYEIERKNDIVFAEPDGVKLLLDLYLPVGVENSPLIMHIHGGGWKGGDRKNCKIAWAASHGYAIASVEYRMSHEAVFPAQIHDCKGALRWLRANAKEYGYDVSRVLVTGTSAGGHLSALMATSGGVEHLEGTTGGNLEQSSRVEAAIDYYGANDFVKRSENQPSKTDDPKGSVYQLLGGPVKGNLEAARMASPVTYVSEDDPPILIIHGAKDKTVLLDQSEFLKEAYDSAGVEAILHVEEEKGHGWKTPGEDEKLLVLDFLERTFAE